MGRFWHFCPFLLQILLASVLFSSANGRGLRPINIFTTIVIPPLDPNWKPSPNTFANAPIHSHRGDEAPPLQSGSGTPSTDPEPIFQTLPFPAFRPYPPFRNPHVIPCPPGFYPLYPPYRDVGPGGTAAPGVSPFHRHAAGAGAAKASSKSTLYYRDMTYPYFPFPYPFSIRCYPFPHIIRPLPSPPFPWFRPLPLITPAPIAPAAAPGPAPALATLP